MGREGFTIIRGGGEPEAVTPKKGRVEETAEVDEVFEDLVEDIVLNGKQFLHFMVLASVMEETDVGTTTWKAMGNTVLNMYSLWKRLVEDQTNT